MLVPNVKQEDGIWIGNIILDSWNNFFDKTMDIELNIGGDRLIKSINSKHILAFEYLVENQEKLLQIILNALLVEYPIMQEEYGYEYGEKNIYMPDVENIQEFKKIIKPKRIYILDIENNGMAYLGFCFNCSWDEEHDYGVMIHNERVIKMGGGDVAFMSWIAEEDINRINS